MNINELGERAKEIRKLILLMVSSRTNIPHVGSALSCTDILTVLYGDSLHVDARNPARADRDRFILSKGHAAAALYATLAVYGFCDRDHVEHNFCAEDSPLIGHVTHTAMPGIEASSGSLGHGLSIGTGLAFSAKRKNQDHRVYVLCSDGEMNEGSFWEAIFFAGHHHLANLIVIIDFNGIQSFGRVGEVLNPEPLAAKFQAFHWAVKEINGHNLTEIYHALHHRNLPLTQGKPSAIIARTTKGKGVGKWENKLESHYHNPSREEALEAIQEIMTS